MRHCTCYLNVCCLFDVIRVYREYSICRPSHIWYTFVIGIDSPLHLVLKCFDSRSKWTICDNYWQCAFRIGTPRALRRLCRMSCITILINSLMESFYVAAIIVARNPCKAINMIIMLAYWASHIHCHYHLDTNTWFTVLIYLGICIRAPMFPIGLLGIHLTVIGQNINSKWWWQYVILATKFNIMIRHYIFLCIMIRRHGKPKYFH